jgi:hypothetical protein
MKQDQQDTGDASERIDFEAAFHFLAGHRIQVPFLMLREISRRPDRGRVSACLGAMFARVFALECLERNQARHQERAPKKQTVASRIVLCGIPHQANSCYVVATNAQMFRQMNQSGKP